MGCGASTNANALLVSGSKMDIGYATDAKPVDPSPPQSTAPSVADGEMRPTARQVVAAILAEAFEQELAAAARPESLASMEYRE